MQVSANVAPRKVAIVHECDRMNLPAANIFLKTLEEPPANTTLLLLTTRPYALLPTIRSRVLLFRFPATGVTIEHAGFPAWLADYQDWLGRLVEGVSGKREVADRSEGFVEFAAVEPAGRAIRRDDGGGDARGHAGLERELVAGLLPRHLDRSADGRRRRGISGLAYCYVRPPRG